VLNPATGEIIAEVPKGTEEDVDRAVAAARKAYDEVWFDTTPAERSVMLLKLADVIESNGEELSHIESENVGKPYASTLSEEIPPIRGQPPVLRRRSAAPGGPGRRRVHEGLHQHVAARTGGRGRLHRSVELPLMMAIWKLGPALAAGTQSS